ncbi:SusC/RagA family TonB-linked outer membrane protein [Puteibacter caeruleilacunae]|nr:SusC/RagA family TonB-linked outer membrane protein [Puteibacter caeruleilacunae]
MCERLILLIKLKPIKSNCMKRKCKLWSGIRLNQRGIILALIILFFCSSIESLSASVLQLDNKFSIQVKNMTVKEVLKEIEEQSDYRFFYNENFAVLQRVVSLDVKDAELEVVLKDVFKDSDVTYKLMDDKMITITPKAKPSKQNKSIEKITGKVTEASGETLPGVSIVVKGTTIGTVTDFDGNYELLNVPDDAVLVFSFVGMRTQEIAVGSNTSIDMVMEEDAIGLEEVVAIGYGVTKKKDLVSSVSSVESEVLQNQPTPRIDQALQGRASGVEVTSNSGAPGAAATIRIRGTSSINGNNNPLFVIDGFIVGTDFNLNSLNVNDIESIEVLKDATALSIYGTRGASGVILVSTKNGKKAKGGKPNVSVNHYSSIQSMNNELEVLSGQDYLDYKNEEARFVPGSDGFGAIDTSIELPYPEGGDFANTDWVDLISQTGYIHNTDVSVAGNAEHVNYYLSLNHFDQEGVIKNSGLQRYLFRSNFDFDLADKWRAGVRMNVSHVKQENNKVDFSKVLYKVLPIRSVYNEDGTYNGINPQSGREESNPVADVALRQDHRLETSLVGNGYVEFKPIEGMVIKSTVGTEITNSRNNKYLPGQLPERLEAQLGGSATVSQNQIRSFLNENTANYKKDFDDHSLTVLAGITWQKQIKETSWMSATGFVNDAVGYNNIAMGSDASTFQMKTNYVQRTFFSLLSRINYSYKSKYLLTLVGRRDGSSVFEEGNKFAFFPSLGAAWNVTEEDFMKSFDNIYKLKLRASYGVVGEQGVRPYNSLATFEGTNTYFNEVVANGVVIGALPSSDLTWETTKQFDVGFELGLYDGRLNFEVDYYQKRTKDLLLERKVPGTVGDTQLQNIGEIENKGVELAINSVNISKKNLSWETTLTLSANRNKVVDLGGAEFIDLEGPSYSNGSIRLLPGQTVPTFVGVKYLGTYKTRQEIIDDKMQGKAFLGSPRYDDLDDNGVLNEEDKIILGSPEPDLYGGLRNMVTWNNFTFDMFIQFSLGNDIFNGSNATAFFGRGEENLSTKVVDRWIEGVNETSDIPRAGTSKSIFNPVSDVWIEDGSFARLKSLSVSYNLPVKKMGLGKVFKQAKVNLTGNNLLLITNFSQGDPEVSNFGDGLSQGVAAGSYPYTTSFTAGVTLDF